MKHILHIIIIVLCLVSLTSTGSFASEPSVCFDCHADIAKDWQQSIHAKNGISCHNCHGGNPKDADTAMDPKFGFVGRPSEAGIPEFCGKCHMAIKDNYSKSRHSMTLNSGGPSCVTCHTAHKQQRANIGLISADLCGKCHTFERADKIRSSMLMTESEIENLGERIDDLRVQGYDVDGQKKELFATRNQFHRLTHVVDVDLILKETSGIQAKIQGLKDEISADEKTEVRRKMYGSIFIFFLLLGALVFWWYRNTTLSDD